MLLGIEASHANKLQRTGVEEYCFQIIQELKKIIPASEQVILYTNAPLQGGLEVLPDNWRVKVLYWPLKKMWSQVRLALELAIHPPDVFFAPGQLISFFTPPKTVSMIHDSAFVARPELYRFWGRQYLRLMNWLIMKKSTRLITSSLFNQSELEKFFGAEVSLNTAVIPLAYNKDKYHADISPLDVSNKYGITKPFIISIGRLEAKKNTRRLIQAYDLIKKQHDIQMVLVGRPGCGYEAIENALAKSPNRSDIIFPGYVEQNDLPAMLTAAQVFVFPSVYEGFGLPMLEAMAVGTPVVAARGSALAEVGGDGVLYVDAENIFDLAEAVGSLLKNDSLRQKSVLQGLDRVKNFSWEKTASSTWVEIVKTAENCYTKS